MSASILNHLDSGEPESVRKRWLNGAKSIGCVDEENSSEESFTPKIMQCLRDTSPEVLQALIESSELKDINGWSPQVVIDGQFLPKRPLEMLKSGDYKKNVNLMIGSTQDEGSFVLPWKMDPIKYHPISPQNLTYSEAYEELKRIASGLRSKIPINGEDVAKLYFTGLSDNNDFDLLRRTIGIAIGDWYIGCPTIQFAKTLFKNDRNSNVYQYYYNSKLGEEKLICSKWMGVCHANDIWPVFGIPFRQFDRHLDRERDISAQMIDFFSNFAKTGFVFIIKLRKKVLNFFRCL
jgi:carboxylesterase type B